MGKGRPAREGRSSSPHRDRDRRHPAAPEHRPSQGPRPQEDQGRTRGHRGHAAQMTNSFKHTYQGHPFTPEADALALQIGVMVAKAPGTHKDKFLALLAVVQALGVTTEMFSPSVELHK